jgi:hypothetical protein
VGRRTATRFWYQSSRRRHLVVAPIIAIYLLLLLLRYTVACCHPCIKPPVYKRRPPFTNGRCRIPVCKQDTLFTNGGCADHPIYNLLMRVPCLNQKKILQEKTVEATKQKEEMRKKHEPEEQEQVFPVCKREIRKHPRFSKTGTTRTLIPSFTNGGFCVTKYGELRNSSICIRNSSNSTI